MNFLISPVCVRNTGVRAQLRMCPVAGYVLPVEPI